MDELARATRALREFGSAGEDNPVTRAGVLRGLRKKRLSRRWLVGVPALAILFGSTAYAAAGGELPKFVSTGLVLLGVSEPKEQPPPPSAPPAKRRAAQPREPVVLPEVEPNVVPVDEPEPPRPSANDRAAEGTPVARAQPTPAGESATPIVDDAHAVYKRAHQSHFHRGDHRAALVGYEAYLREQPNGRFAVDARYNRALVLVHLGRLVEAKAILTAFAEGRYGGYRQRDATRLIEALELEAQNQKEDAARAPE